MPRWSPANSASRPSSAWRRSKSTSRRAACTSTAAAFKEGDWISIDGTTGEVFAGQVPTILPDVTDPYLIKLLCWADSFRRLQVWANADYPRDAERARRFGAQGIGLCRTEHMFFETERLPIVQKMILADAPRGAPGCPG